MADTYKKYQTNTDGGDENTTNTPVPDTDTGTNTSSDSIPMSDRQSPQEPARGSESDTITGNESAVKERVERTYTEQKESTEKSGSDSSGSSEGGDTAQASSKPEVRNV